MASAMRATTHDVERFGVRFDAGQLLLLARRPAGHGLEVDACLAEATMASGAWQSLMGD
jgi:hypothetical protein